MDTKSNDDSGGSDSLDKSMQRKCVMVETSPTTTEPAAETDNCSRDSAALRESPPGEPKTDVSSAESTIGENSTTFKSSSSNSNTSAAFESKVKLISQNLKETTLAESEASAPTTNTSNDVADGPLIDDVVDQHSNTDSCEQRVKKVRFHPDVKANDGGNRVKKKRRSAQNSANKANLSCDGMDVEDDDNECGDDADHDEEEEEEFNLAKTIAEADDYLKQHPLTFVRRVEQNGERLRDGLLNIEDMPQLVEREVRAEKNNEDDFYKKCKPENGIERVLGKETKAGKVEYLLRYENQGGLFWESEDFIRRMCPNLLKAYEKNRERRQQRLMHHVAKRQSLRQRYTDF
ncbi:uncharacterized protein LOC6577847 [Drosophila mojavensis]|uniref:Uncharacterized protein, isoform A n=1 Tax=Drosophila mojavensis TaxID=7230 RepID=B4KGM1_DROMO|nr:uncharacterized protein LOC6577847 [Drosophila mojavensis]EDW13221.1 uncharacterized protein Dmoj_GI21215, isoform A [Drosophila mojavensis]KRG03618.1 uncharacterized protein Dmoj_GI21215, isoform B [Drosophila mojavensis]